MSPNNAERLEKGYSSAWLHHKGKNKHHLEYWIDYGIDPANKMGEGLQMVGMKMPLNYVIEMFIDRVSACKNYQKEKYTDESAWIYYKNSRAHYILHPDTRAMLEFLLMMLWKLGEEKTFTFVKNEVLKGKVAYDKKELDMRKDAL